MGSRNGTFLKGIRVRAPTRLSHGDEICIGHGLARLRFVSG
jgi:pSer/pThr/pTyr-binding forkhead associated (FHA) protein